MNVKLRLVFALISVCIFICSINCGFVSNKGKFDKIPQDVIMHDNLYPFNQHVYSFAPPRNPINDYPKIIEKTHEQKNKFDNKKIPFKWGR